MSLRPTPATTDTHGRSCTCPAPDGDDPACAFHGYTPATIGVRDECGQIIDPDERDISVEAWRGQ